MSNENDGLTEVPLTETEARTIYCELRGLQLGKELPAGGIAEQQLVLGRRVELDDDRMTSRAFRVDDPCPRQSFAIRLRQRKANKDKRRREASRPLNKATLRPTCPRFTPGLGKAESRIVLPTDGLSMRFGPAGAMTATRGTKTGIGNLIGYAVVYDSPSEDLGNFREVIRPGTFGEQLGRGDPEILALYGHDWQNVLGRQNNGTLSVQSDSHGLRINLALPDTTLGRDLMALVAVQTIAGMSFLFRTLPGGESWSDKSGETIRYVTKAIVYEVSCVCTPAYKATSIHVAGVGGRSIALPRPAGSCGPDAMRRLRQATAAIAART